MEIYSVTLTPRRCAYLLIEAWMQNGGTAPWHFTQEELKATFAEGWKYNVTEKRYAEILRQIDVVLTVFRRNVYRTAKAIRA